MRFVRRIAAHLRTSSREPERATGPTMIDLRAPAIAIDPFPHYEELRRAGSVHFLPHHGFWILLGYDDVQTAFAQPQLFSTEPYQAVDPVLLAAAPPSHTAIRRLLAPHFSAEALGRLAAFAEERAAALMKPELDVVAGYAAPLTQLVAAQLIGLEGAPLDELLDAHRRSLRAADPFASLFSALDPFVERAAMFETLLREGDGAIDDAEARSLVRLMWMAATVTTERLIAWSVFYLAQDEELRRSVAGDANRLASFLEEVVRLHPAEHMIPRRTTAAVELSGVSIPAEAIVKLCISAANRDPARFSEPAVLQPNRQPNRHVSFGSGIHHCIGGPLARRVSGVALRTLLRTMPDFRALEPLSAIRYYSSETALAPAALRIGAKGNDER